MLLMRRIKAAIALFTSSPSTVSNSSSRTAFIFNRFEFELYDDEFNFEAWDDSFSCWIRLVLFKLLDATPESIFYIRLLLSIIRPALGRKQTISGKRKNMQEYHTLFFVENLDIVILRGTYNLFL